MANFLKIALQVLGGGATLGISALGAIKIKERNDIHSRDTAKAWFDTLTLSDTRTYKKVSLGSYEDENFWTERQKEYGEKYQDWREYRDFCYSGLVDAKYNGKLDDLSKFIVSSEYTDGWNGKWQDWGKCLDFEVKTPAMGIGSGETSVSA